MSQTMSNIYSVFCTQHTRGIQDQPGLCEQENKLHLILLIYYYVFSLVPQLLRLTRLPWLAMNMRKADLTLLEESIQFAKVHGT